MIPLEPTLSKIRNDCCRTRGARGGSDLNRTRGYAPPIPPRGLGGNPEENASCISDLAGGMHFEKLKGRFLRGSALDDSGSRRGEIRTDGKNFFCAASVFTAYALYPPCGVYPFIATIQTWKAIEAL